MILYIISGLAILAVIYLIFTYNRFVTLRNRVEEAWSDIDVQLKRRHDLIPNLVETVKGYASHEKEVFQKVTEARSRAMQAEETGDPEQMQQAENQLSSALKSLFAVSENYPDLKASENFMELQREITDTENKIQAARRFYNRNVKSLNTKTEKFPSNLVASMFGIEQWKFFEADEKERETVEVSFEE